MPEVKTVSVLWPDKGTGTFLINEADFDPQRHKLATEDQGTPAQQPGSKEPTSTQRRKRHK